MKKGANLSLEGLVLVLSDMEKEETKFGRPLTPRATAAGKSPESHYYSHRLHMDEDGN